MQSFQTGGSHRESPELSQPKVCQEVCRWLLLWNSAKAEVWGLWHWQQDDWPDWRWLPGWTRMHPGPSKVSFFFPLSVRLKVFSIQHFRIHFCYRSKQDFAGAKLVGLCCKRTLQCYHVADEALTSLISSFWFDSYECNVTSCVYYAWFVICFMVCRLMCSTHLFSGLHSEPIHSNSFAVANCLCQSAFFSLLLGCI